MVKAMSNVSSTSNVSQQVFQKLNTQLARKNADQAEAIAQSLRAQAAEAQNLADRDQQKANALSAESDQAQITADNEKQLFKTANGIQQKTNQSVNTINQNVVQPAYAIAPSSSSISKLISTQASVTGTNINTQA